MVHGEPVVIERSAKPSTCGVAVLAGRWKTCRGMVRIGGALIDSLVTREAVGWHRRVIVVHVAIRTRDGCVGSGQRKGSLAVVKGGRLPGRDVMAKLTLRREAGDHMIRASRALEILEMARGTGRVRQMEISLNVALATCR